MAIKIKLKNSVTQDAVPTGTHLPEVGELAVNANINSIGGYMRASDNSIVKIFGPGSVSTPAASTTVAGIAELATSAETTTGTDTARVCTPAGVKAVTDAERTTSNSTYLALSGGTLVGVLQATAGSNSAPAIHFGDSDSGIYGGTNTVSLAAGGTQGLTLNSSAYVNVPTRLGVGIAAPVRAFHIHEASAASAYLHMTNATTGSATSDGFSLYVSTAGEAYYRARETTGKHIFYVNSNEAARVDSSRRLLVGASSDGAPLSYGSKLQVNSTGADGSIVLGRHAASTSAPVFIFQKSRATSVNGNTTVLSGDNLGFIRFHGADGTDRDSIAAEIYCKTEGTVAGNRMPGALVFGTTADSAGSVSPTPRLTIDSAGKCGIGTENPGSLLELNAANDTAKLTFLRTGTTIGGSINTRDESGADGKGLTYIAKDGNSAKAQHVFYTDDGTNVLERLKIDEKGRTLIGCSSSSYAYSQLVVEGNATFGGGTGGLQLQGGFANPSGGGSGLGELRFTDSNESEAAAIKVESEAAWADGSSYPSYIQFRTTATNATSATERLRILSTGELIQNQLTSADASADDLVIGKTNSGTNRGMTIYSHNAQNGSIAFADNDANYRGAIQYMHNGDRFRILTGGQETLRLQSGGTDGVCTFFMGGVTNNHNKTGALTLNHYSFNTYNQIDLIKGSTTSGSNLIEIGGSGSSAGSTAATEIKLFTAANATTNNGTERLHIHSGGDVEVSSGRLLINTTTEGAAAADNLTLADSGNCGITIRSGNTQSGLIYFSDGASGPAEYAGFIQYSHGSTNAMYLGTGHATRAIISSTGDFQLETGDVIIGTAGKGIQFHPHAAENKLDDYETGTWVPANSHLTITNNETAKYTKIGRLVTVQFDCTYASSPADTAQVGGIITGLPFQPHASGFYFEPTFTNTSGNTADNESLNFLSYVEGSSNNRIIFYSIGNNCTAVRAQTAGYRVRGTVTYMEA